MELPAPKGAGSKEVSGEADGVTLSQSRRRSGSGT